MRIMQTLGRHGGAQEGIFQYKRASSGVTIDPSISRASGPSGPKPSIHITTSEWTSILQAIESAPLQTFRITARSAGSPAQPSQALHTMIQDAVPSPAAGWNWDDSYKSYVVAVLEHEGGLDLYHGLLGAGNPPAIIELKRDIP